MGLQYWLLKTEPSTYSFHQLLKDRRTNWNGVRNFQARNYLKSVSCGDIALIYHSGDEKSVVGIAQVVREAYSDLDPEKKGEWVQVDLKPIELLSRPVSLKEIKTTPSLSAMPLIRASRLSVMPITSDHYQVILRLAGKG